MYKFIYIIHVFNIIVLCTEQGDYSENKNEVQAGIEVKLKLKLLANLRIFFNLSWPLAVFLFLFFSP